MPAVRHTHSIVVTRNRSEVENHNDDFLFPLRLPHETQHALLRIAAVDPLESGWIAVEFMERALRTVRAIQIRYPPLQTAVRIILEQVPFQTTVVRPFRPLAELSAHKQQLFRRLRGHVSVKQP